MRRAGFLRNDLTPHLAQSASFDVKESAVHIRAAGLAAGQAIAIEERVVGRRLEDGVAWTPLVRNGCPVVLSLDNTRHVEVMRGTYRLAPSAPVGAVLVSYEEDESQIDDKIMYTFLVNPQCETPPAVTPPAPPTPDPIVAVTRCDAVTGAPVTILARSVAGVVSVVGHIPASGALTAGPYPGTLGACEGRSEFDHSFFCDPATGNKVLVTTTYSATGVPTVAGYDFPALSPYAGSLAGLAPCPGAGVESDPLVMCDAGVTFIRWVVKNDGQPTGVVYDTDLAGVPYGASPTAVVGSCDGLCTPSTPLGVVAAWG